MPPCQRCCCCRIHANLFSSDKAGSPGFSCAFCLLLKPLKAPCCSLHPSSPKHFLLLSPNPKKLYIGKISKIPNLGLVSRTSSYQFAENIFFALHFHVFLFPVLLTLCCFVRLSSASRVLPLRREWQTPTGHQASVLNLKVVLAPSVVIRMSYIATMEETKL